MKKKKNPQKRFTADVVLVHIKVWFKLSFYPIAIIAVICYFGMPLKLGILLGGIVLIFTTFGALINFLAYIGNIDIPKIL
ncbi:hypothetical protein KAJ89_03415 [Candidatus Parcubacteria bacterium]|nr:hypothetical protein [Candidatus Parcubacteria bacterium]